jgi:hypothetical protein
MIGRFDHTRITTFRLSKADVVSKAKQLCKKKMPVDWKWGLEPHSAYACRRPNFSGTMNFLILLVYLLC